MAVIRIGSFARIAQVSTRTLRLYDKLGLLKPALVDPSTDYRYYSIDQLPRLNRILALKDLGFSLDQIAVVLRSELSAEQLRGMLTMKRAEVERRVAAEQAQLARIAARLRQIEQEDALDTYEVVVKRIEPQWIAAVRGAISDYITSEPIFIQLFEELDAYLAERGARNIGPRVGLFYEHGAQEHEVRIRAGRLLPAYVLGNERVEVEQLRGIEHMACVVHHGPYDETLIQANTALLKWIDANGYQIRTPTREIYLQYQVNGDPSQFVTEIQVPIEVAAAF
ncbi:MAG TPA: MerR family transcriptional regulator [Roseiflexaceae bacterium]|nr:MerR family transcriptional regulator [Roseiflexaceae bacterium]